MIFFIVVDVIFFILFSFTISIFIAVFGFTIFLKLLVLLTILLNILFNDSGVLIVANFKCNFYISGISLFLFSINFIFKPTIFYWSCVVFSLLFVYTCIYKLFIGLIHIVC